MSLFDSLSISRLLSQLLEEVGSLVSKEVDLAKTEMTKKASFLAENAVPVVVATAVLYAGVLILLAGVVFGLATVVPLWLSALCVGVLVTVAGSVATVRALQNWKVHQSEARSCGTSLQADREWLKSKAQGEEG
ncbi:MAG: phage holin family protein [Desulfobacterales bacterium]